jgi:PAS domain S-box-containing protein
MSPREIAVVRRDGTRFSVLVGAREIRDSKGNLRYYQAVHIDITDRKLTEESLQAANAYNRNLIEVSLDPLVTIGKDGKITDVNTATEAVTGFVRSELIGTDFLSYFTEPERARAGYEQVFQSGFVRDFPLDIKHRDGRITSVLYNASIYKDNAGNVIGVFAAARDITARKQAEQLVKQSLIEKELLLKEIHHRVKNNMAVVSSLLSLQARKIKDDAVRSLFEECQQRVKAMALVHGKLSQTKDLSAINIGTYITSIIAEIINLCRIDASAMTTEINVQDIGLDLESAVPCCLIINELLTNAFKHAFPDNRDRVLNVCFIKTDETYILTIKDNGIGLPKGFNYLEANTLGLQLINVLTKQLRGTFQIKSDKGTEAVVTFKR